MVIIDNVAYTTSSQLHTPADEINQVHHRFQNLPPIKQMEHRGTLQGAQDDLVIPQRNRDRYIHRKIPSNRSSHIYHEGVEPSIISSVKYSLDPIQEPSLVRRTSRKMKRKNRRFMTNIKEAKNQFFYPVHAPRRRRSRFGKYRSSFELKATMDYIELDASISKELCLNQIVESYQVKNKDLVKLDPPLVRTTKAITFDSNNNVIIYTPNSSHKNSIITNAEERLDKELLKLNVYKKKVRLPEYKIPRPYYNRYDTAPLTRYPSLIRTRSLPSKLREEDTEALWNLYLRRVLCGRITWRLTHSSQPNLVKDQYQEFEKRKHENLRTPPLSPDSPFTPSRPMFGSELVNRMISAESSVDTGFFVYSELQDTSKFPKKNKSSSSEYLSVSENEHPSDDETAEPHTDDELIIHDSYVSGFTQSPVSPRRQAMLDSLEQLIEDVSSVMSSLDQ